MKKLLLISIMFLMAWQVSASELYPAIMSYQADRTALNRKYNNPLSDEYFERIGRLYLDWLKALENMPYDSYSADGKLDYQIFKNYLEKESYFHSAAFEEYKAVKNVVDFAAPLEKFYQARRMAIKPNAQELAATFTQVEMAMKTKWEQSKKSKPYDSWQKAELLLELW